MTQKPVRPAAGATDGPLYRSENLRRTDPALYQRQLETVADNATLALFIMDERQQCTYMNRAAERLTGFTPDELRGRALHDVIHHTRPNGRPYPLEECPIDQAFPQNMREQGEEVFVHRDGSFYPVAFTASPIREGERTVGTVIEVRDIRQEKEAERQRALLQEAIRESEHRYRALVEVSPQAVWFGRADGYITYCNQYWFDYTGLSMSESEGSGWTRVIHPDHRKRVLDEWLAKREDTSGHEIEIPLRRASDGAYRWFLARGVPLRDSHGQISQWVGIAIDIHERRQAAQEAESARARAEAQAEEAAALAAHLQEQAIELEHQTEEAQALAEELEQTNNELQHANRLVDLERARLGRAVASFPSAAAVMLGADHIFDAASTTYREIIGGRDPVGRSVREVLPELAGQGFFELLDRVYASGEPASGVGVPAAWDNDGDGEAEAHMIDFVYQPLPGPDGRTEGVVVHMLDVSETHRATEALTRSEERYRTLVGATEDIVWVTNPAGEFVEEQPEWAAFTGQPFDEYRGWRWIEAIHPDDRDLTAGAWQAAIRDRTVCEVEYRVRRRDGELRWMRVRAVPVLEADGTVREWVGVETDVTTERLAEAERERLLEEAETARAEAEQANRAKSEFLAAMSHELRTPLNAIAGYADLLELGVYGTLTNTQLEVVNRIKRSEEVLLSLINDVLNFVRLEVGRLEVRSDEVLVGPLLGKLEALIAPQVEAKRLTYLCDPCDPALVACGDPDRIHQVLVNLLSNAVKFTDPGGRIVLSALGDGSQVLIRVQDSGRGISPDKLDAIFDPFVQLDRHEVRQSQQGVGLGLSISRQLAERMGGTLRVESALGEGSVFTLTLPRVGLAATAEDAAG